MVLIIKVFMNKRAMDTSSPCFERIIQWSDGLQVPYDHLFNSMKCLYGSDCIVQFNLQ